MLVTLALDSLMDEDEGGTAACFGDELLLLELLKHGSFPMFFLLGVLPLVVALDLLSSLHGKGFADGRVDLGGSCSRGFCLRLLL